MMIGELAVGGKGKERIIKRAISRPCLNTLVCTDHEGDFQITRDLRESLRFLSWNC